MAGDDGIGARAEAWLVPESLAVARVLDDDLVVAANFRIDPAGHVCFAVFARPGVNERRVGRVVQRLCEVETALMLQTPPDGPGVPGWGFLTYGGERP